MTITISAPDHANRAPDRSLTQRLDALEQANRVRSYRARLKRDIKAGRLSEEQLDDLVANPPDHLLSMRVTDFLLALPWVGESRVDRCLVLCQASRSRSLGGLSDRQRLALRSWLRRRAL